MEIKEAQTEAFALVEDWNRRQNAEHNPQTVFPHLIEEVGEVARELNHYISNWRQEPNKERLEEEMADVFIQLCILAKDNEIELDEAVSKKLNKNRKRFDL